MSAALRRSRTSRSSRAFRGLCSPYFFAEGVEARQGQALFVIDPRPYRAALAQARADLAKAQAAVANARTELTRAQKLLDAEAVSREEFETKQATLRSAVASAESARAAVDARALDVSFTTVTSPIAGRVSDKRVSVGSFSIGRANGADARRHGQSHSLCVRRRGELLPEICAAGAIRRAAVVALFPKSCGYPVGR